MLHCIPDKLLANGKTAVDRVRVKCGIHASELDVFLHPVRSIVLLRAGTGEVIAYMLIQVAIISVVQKISKLFQSSSPDVDILEGSNCGQISLLARQMTFVSAKWLMKRCKLVLEDE